MLTGLFGERIMETCKEQIEFQKIGEELESILERQYKGRYDVGNL